MIPWEHIDTATVPDDGGELRLMRRGAEWSIMAGANELMNNRLSGSEQALATLVIEKLKDRPAARYLIGGYGMGFTLRAALRCLGPQARVTVAELVPAVIAWARGPMADLAAGCLDDPRVTIHDGDVGLAIGAAEAGYDAILLDVDNGPEGLSRKDNDRLYDDQGLAAVRRALTPGGILAVWSSGPNLAFTQRLRRAGFATQEMNVRATDRKRGSQHVIWLATAPSHG